jgi:hypothetical protein
MGWLRCGGRGIGAAGERSTWSVAEGGRGTRWREVATRGEAVARSVLMEVAPDGHPTRLEVATAAGLLTLHPEPDGSALHGNVVTPEGIRHLTFDWSDGHALLVVASPIAAAVLCRWFIDRVIEPGAAVRGDGVVIDDALLPAAAAWTAVRSSAGLWSVRWDGGSIGCRLDEHGLPVLRDAVRWPLET